MPSPIQARNAGDCNSHAEAGNRDFCFKFAQDKGITTDQLYSWNTVLGTEGANCGTQFFKGYWCCVGIDSRRDFARIIVVLIPVSNSVSMRKGTMASTSESWIQNLKYGKTLLENRPMKFLIQFFIDCFTGR